MDYEKPLDDVRKDELFDYNDDDVPHGAEIRDEEDEDNE